MEVKGGFISFEKSFITLIINILVIQNLEEKEEMSIDENLYFAYMKTIRDAQ
jgi:hypothetical protein